MSHVLRTAGSWCFAFTSLVFLQDYYYPLCDDLEFLGMTWDCSHPTWNCLRPTWDCSRQTWDSSRPTYDSSRPTWDSSRPNWVFPGFPGGGLRICQHYLRVIHSAKVYRIHWFRCTINTRVYTSNITIHFQNVKFISQDIKKYTSYLVKQGAGAAG